MHGVPARGNFVIIPIMKNYLAIDIGASSGRHILGCVRDGKITLEEVYRFENSQVRQDGHDCWDIDKLVDSVKAREPLDQYNIYRPEELNWIKEAYIKDGQLFLIEEEVQW